jgi:hypothetical protein
MIILKVLILIIFIYSFLTINKNYQDKIYNLIKN